MAQLTPSAALLDAVVRLVRDDGYTFVHCDTLRRTVQLDAASFDFGIDALLDGRLLARGGKFYTLTPWGLSAHAQLVGA